MSSPGWQVVYDAKAVVGGELAETQRRIQHHTNEARLLESRETMLQEQFDRLQAMTEKYEADSREEKR